MDGEVCLLSTHHGLSAPSHQRQPARKHTQCRASRGMLSLPFPPAGSTWSEGVNLPPVGCRWVLF